MNALPPGSGRATVRKDEDNLWIDIPAKRNWMLLIFRSVWMSSWIIGGVLLIVGLFLDIGRGDPVPLYLLVAFLAWSFPLWVVGSVLDWQIYGTECVHFRRDEMSVTISSLFWRRTASYPVTDVSRIRIQKPNSDRLLIEWMIWGVLFGKGEEIVKFDCGHRTHGFGLDLDEAEAAVLIAAIETFLSDRALGRGT
ncbi:MAG: hypothetical protein AAF666_14380 [Pseudomonadota bacterium]